MVLVSAFLCEAASFLWVYPMILTQQIDREIMMPTFLKRTDPTMFSIWMGASTKQSNCFP